VTWRHTKEAANQILTFREKYECQTVQMVVGSFARIQPEMPIWTMPLFDTVKLKNRWLAEPVDAIGGLTEEQAKQMIANLGGK